ncbi:sensor histidine kinase [Pelagerythrobacter aerophilus]|uniref:histidine kinase n=1 Tax=Pelagerythrobacter aerophilus TaxID=2306995 RepID=A0A418NJ23_9SPHN|nr:HAMP domain-containing sensor histidine kinase [Pelagerythrobacter aerophilus]RIV79316.1 sensor histidine kinase [Pelagerythrobacter aerophilus]
MNAHSPSYLARGRTDAEDRLIEADELLAALQRSCGGEIPGVLAVPALLERVRQARAAGTRLSGAIEAFGGEDIIHAWIEVFPHSGNEAGCSIGIADWQVSPAVREDNAQAAVRHLEIERSVADLWARLDPAQGVLAAEAHAPDLAALALRMMQGAGRPWTDFVELPGAVHEQPMHWRLLDGLAVRVPESPREWTVTLAPLGGPEPGQSGFELYLASDAVLPTGEAPPHAELAGPPATHLIGRNLAPVLRQPIARIIANAETIRTRLAGPLAEEYSNYAADIAAAGQHLLALIEDLSDLEVVEAEGFATAPDEIDLGDVAHRAAGILAVRAKEKGIALTAPPAGRPVPAVAEFRRVLQILLNLVGNAIRYSPEGSQIRLELSAEGARASVSVIDEGPGLDAEQQARVFEKFERLGRSGDGGSGLGLYISRRLARAMGGDLTVQSELGSGANFTLELPAAHKSQE